MGCWGVLWGSMGYRGLLEVLWCSVGCWGCWGALWDTGGLLGVLGGSAGVLWDYWECCGALWGAGGHPLALWGRPMPHGCYGADTPPTPPASPPPHAPQVLCVVVVGLLAPPAPPTLAPALLQALAGAAALGGRLLRDPPRLPHGYGPCLVRTPPSAPHVSPGVPSVLILTSVAPP